LKELVLNELRINHSVLAPCIIQADWKNEEGVILFEVANSYAKTTIEKNRPIITKIIQGFWQENTKILVQLVEKITEQANDEKHPESVEAVCNMFKGKVISKTEAAVLENTTNNENGDDDESF